MRVAQRGVSWLHARIDVAYDFVRFFSRKGASDEAISDLPYGWMWFGREKHAALPFDHGAERQHPIGNAIKVIVKL